MYDVIVIGAGPGGSTAARSLAMSGLDVCLIDKDEFPRDKPCGGGFSRSIIDDFSYLKPRTTEFLKGVARIGVLHSPNRRIILEGRVDMALALRMDFDYVLFQEAVSAGASSFTNARAKKVFVHDTKVSVELANGKTVEGKIIIGADGVTSMVAREVGLNKRWPSSSVTACKVCEVPASTQDILNRYSSDLKYHFYTNFGNQPGYGWIFPKQETINIGLGIVGTYARGLPRAFDTFVEFLKRKDFLPENADLSTSKGALVPTAGPIKQTIVDRCLLVGDSAGQVSPLTGGGIGHAMTAGRYAAKVATHAIENDSMNATSLEEYQSLWQSDFGGGLQKQLIAQKVFTSPFANLLFQIGSKDERIQEIVSESLAESSGGEIDVRQLTYRTLVVCLREAFKL
jgi:geranylgeranyl reductase family protein